MRQWKQQILMDETRDQSRRLDDRRRFNRVLRGGDDHNGFSSSCFGPIFWHTWHILSRNYLPKKKHDYILWLKGFMATLPCKPCRVNLPARLQEVGYNIDDHASNAVYDSRQQYTEFVYNVHNAVNEAINKPKPYPSLNDVIRYYEQFRAKTCSQKEEVGCRNQPRIEGTTIQTRTNS